MVLVSVGEKHMINLIFAINILVVYFFVGKDSGWEKFREINSSFLDVFVYYSEVVGFI